MLAGPLPPGGFDALARPAVLRLLHGSFAIDAMEIAAIAAVAAWLVAKPLAVVAALLWLELRFSPGAGHRNFLVAWGVQAFTISFVVLFTTLLSLLDVFPEPLLKIEAAGSTLTLLVVLLPAFFLNLLITEFFQYWIHRAFHHFPLLWRFHALHHSLEVNVLNNIGHPVESVLAILFVGIPTALLIGVSHEQLFLVVAFTSIQGHINHTLLPIHLGPLSGTLLCDNRFHVIHHSLDPAHFNKNFANIPIWDMVFGTYVPSSPRLIPTGLADRAPPRTIGQYLTVRLPTRAEGQATA